MLAAFPARKFYSTASVIWHRARARGLLEESIQATRRMMLMREKEEKDFPGKEKGGGTETDTLHVEASKVCEVDGGKHEICAGVRPAPVRPQAVT